jgi:TPR repeat protein
MRLKLGIWSAFVVVVFAAVLAAAPAVLKSAHLHWPAWPIALAAGIVTVLAGVAKPVYDTVTEKWADRTKRELERQDRVRELEHVVGGRAKGLPTAGEITDRALLGIHPSIPLPSGADPSLSPDLPLYIPRDVDADLRAWITAHRESGGFLLLVGPATSGKSRSAYELVHDMLADWPMFMPSTSTQLTEYFDADPTLERLVVWLNDTQKFLGPDGLTAATVHRILASSRRVIIIGTIWPRDYDSLTSSPGTDLRDADQDTRLGDANQDSREILTMFAYRKDLLPGFSRPELDRAESLATRDPRIAEATNETVSPNLVETLAAAPDLISRWLNAADPYGAAVITAAVIARRCGHPEPIPADILESLAETVLTPADRGRAAVQWFQAALAWARAPVRGSAAPLTPQAATPGIILGDQVSDILVQHAAREQSAPGHNIPEATWLLLIEKATPQACLDIASVAYRQRKTHRSRITERAIRKAATTGSASAMYNLGVVLSERGNDSEAEEWLRKAADAGDALAMAGLGILRGKHGNDSEAEGWFRKAADAGNTYGMFRLGLGLARQRNYGGAEEWLRKAANAGHVGAIACLGLVLVAEGNDSEAEEWLRKAADAGDANAMTILGELFSRQRNYGEAEEWWRKAADAGDANAMYRLGRALRKRGSDGEAEEWWRKAATAGNSDASSALAILLREHGSDGDAEG